MTRTARLDLLGPFDLREVALISFGDRDEASFDGVMRLAFCVEASLEQQVGVEVRQSGGSLELSVHDGPGGPAGRADLDAVTAQVARIVSADHDGEAFAQVCSRDPVLARVHDRAPGFRPALFCSPYEAALWSVISARRPRRQGIGLRAALSERHGAVFELAGQPVSALPTPSALLALDAFPGLPDDRVPRLHAIAEAAARGQLETERLVVMSPGDAISDLQRLPGIGPFYSSLILIRACGLTDVLSTQEQHTRAAVRDLYGLDHEPDDAELREIAEAWRPYRTWAAVLLRAVGSRP